MNLLDALIRTGLTKNESELYIALNREGELTGYEAAKVTGIPRANTYQSLAALVDKGGAYVIEGAAQRYIALPPEEYCRNAMEQMKQVTAVIQKQCPRRKKPSEPYVTITGFKHIIHKMKNIINHAQERIYISSSESELIHVRTELADALYRGLKVVAIVSGDFHMDGIVSYKTKKNPGQIRLIADSSTVLTGTVTGSLDDICLYSKNLPLVELIKDSLKNEIALAERE